MKPRNSSGQNFRNQDGGWPHAIAAVPVREINFVMPEHDTLVFVEVRYRANSDFGALPRPWIHANRPGGAVTAKYYLQNPPRASKKVCRFDIVAITGDGEDGLFRWSRDVF